MADTTATTAQQLDAVRAEMQGILDRAQSDDSRDLTEDEATRFDTLDADSKELERKYAEEAAEVVRRESAAKARRDRIETITAARGRVDVNEKGMYDRQAGSSFFIDLARMHKGDYSAKERMFEHSRQMNRALNTTTGTIGEFAPPVWMVDEFIKLARPGRPTADIMPHQVVPKGVSSLHIPRIKTGTKVAVQGAQNTPIQMTDMTSDSVSVSFTTLAGGQVISQQLLDQTPIANFDRVILQDLAADYAMEVDNFVVNDATSGLSAMSTNGANAIDFSGTAVTGAAFVQALYRKVAGAIAAINEKRYMPPSHIIMSPNRWYDIISTFDNQGRPLAVPAPVAVNPIATTDDLPVQGFAGMWLGMRVILDNAVPDTKVFVIRASDMLLLESAPVAGVFEQTYAQNLSVFVRLYAYVGFTANRYPASTSIITGSQLTTPTF